MQLPAHYGYPPPDSFLTRWRERISVGGQKNRKNDMSDTRNLLKVDE